MLTPRFRIFSCLRRSPVLDVAVIGVVCLSMLVTGVRDAWAQGHTQTQQRGAGANAENFSRPERQLFLRLLCMCGDCARESLSTCTCDFAAATRRSMRERLGQGVPADEIVNAYVSRYGAAALSVPPDQGHNRAVWFVPVAAIAAGALVAFALVRRWTARTRMRHAPRAKSAAVQPGHDANQTGDTTTDREYDSRIDQELRGLDD